MHAPAVRHESRLRLFALSIVRAGALLAALALIPAPCKARQPAPQVGESGAAAECRILALTNALRERAGVPPLRLERRLSRAARWLARDMAANDYLSHTDRRGRFIDERIPACGYDDYTAIGENLGGGQTTAEEVVACWMRSPSHRANLLSPQFSEMGAALACSRASRYRNCWVQEFGSRTSLSPQESDGEVTTRSLTLPAATSAEAWQQRMRSRSATICGSARQANKRPSTLLLALRPGRHALRAEADVEAMLSSDAAALLCLQ